MKLFCVTIDDNIRFLQELTEGKYESLFSHPYTGLLKKLHDKYGVKMQLNLFYQNESFTLAQTTDKYRGEWEQNADWLKLSFHSRLANVRPYERSGYDEVYRDCNAVHKEILRFAGRESLGKTTTVHYCLTTDEGTRAIKDSGVQGLLGLYGTDDEPRISYSCSLEESKRARGGEIVRYGNLAFSGIDVVLNNHKPQEIVSMLHGLKDREFVKIMIHEQHFYSDWQIYYESDYAARIESAVEFLQSQGFESRFFEEIINNRKIR